MTHKACIRIAEVVTADILLNQQDTIKADRQLVQRGGLTLLPDAPVLVNHDKTRAVGRVVELAEWDLWDGVWLVARCELDVVPEWCRKQTAASYGYATISEQAIGEWSRLSQALVIEVSILSPSVQPREPRARVMLLEELPAAAPQTSDRGVAAGDRLLPPQRIVRRNVGEVLRVR